MVKDIINKYKKIVDFKIQTNQEIEDFFCKNLKCEYVPNGVVEFYKECDGGRLSINEILSLSGIEASLKVFQLFLKAMDIDYNKFKYVPIANDGMGGFYAFLSNQKEETIYYLDHEFPEEIQQYDNFEEFLEDICELDLDLG